ncbi:AraC family transcriptional regulator [Streptomyces sp. NRRL F-5755]|uniref:GlxA family transcriptional regulator n=1 Tax=Streptomyces sp. NRRL F-5755 TaxID=1519475 RepID=UPI0006AFDD94|nr:DJ-1/PfpI family protein [Streptomyces sp. NRRL F-5755]KOT92215.1 AraC family transcriptional regulator [Streptomyces sp. NRRL F-5755]
MEQRDVLVVLFDGVQSLDVTGPLEVFTQAALRMPGAYPVRTASLDGAPVRTGSGLMLTPDLALSDAGPPHTLLVPGGRGTREPDARLVDWLRLHAPRARRTVSVCTGAFLLAAAGLLDGRRATTHWTRCAELAAEFPAVRVDPEPIYVRDDDVATSAGVTAGIDLALALVEEDLGRDLALAVARHLVVFLRRPGNQTQFSAQLAAQTADRRPLRDVQQWITENPAADLSVETLAARAGLSPRHFARAFRDEVGMTPGRYVDRVRLEAARRLLEDTADGIEGISRRCGYGTPEAMRRAFLRTLGAAPAEYRRRFRPVAPPPFP